MPLFSRQLLKRPDIAVLAAFLLACLALNLLPSGLKQSVGDGVVGVFFAPLELPVFQFKSLMGSWRENTVLRDELAAVKLENIALTQAKRENDQLRSLLGLKTSTSWSFVAAQVSGREPALLTPDLRIDRGAGNGLARGMPVMGVSGLVGKLIDVQGDAAAVQTVFDPQSRVSAIDLRSRVLGVFRTVKGAQCILDLVPVRTDVRAGDTIVSSGYGQVFPFGLPLGVVETVSARKHNLTALITIRPALDPNHLTHVFIITGGSNPALPAIQSTLSPANAPMRRRSAPAISPSLKLTVPQLRIELPDTIKLQPERGR